MQITSNNDGDFLETTTTYEIWKEDGSEFTEEEKNTFVGKDNYPNGHLIISHWNSTDQEDCDLYEENVSDTKIHKTYTCIKPLFYYFGNSIGNDYDYTLHLYKDGKVLRLSCQDSYGYSRHENYTKQ